MATKRRELDNTGLRLSYVGFGTSPLSNVFGRVSPAVVVVAVRHALDLGINFFDTFPYYRGGSARQVPQGDRGAARGGRRLHQVRALRRRFDFSAERVSHGVNESLARLNLDYVNILYCHDIEFAPFVDQER
ncbi:L-galactose dehydrogenase-like [Ananas comosus]|uniref:L-galactose dehydrogenase-like n=1 Tax=Ananas comosus TaxID=4615 RepID=A0A6P5EII8_ANACO|nr:L-galactose dehydrogenase-like [Ananas comosus]